MSHETIYQYIYQNKRDGGVLYMHLRRRHTYRKRVHKYSKRVGWDARRPISEQPSIVETRSRLGDWEIDTIIGRERKGGIAGRETLALVPASKGPDQVGAEAVCQRLLSVKDKVLTITSDNGIEFMRHQKIAAGLNADFFFADPYSSWQRGTVENTNGLVRQYFPKKTAFAPLAETDLQFVSHRLNNTLLLASIRP